MRFANYAGRSALVTNDGVLDLETASAGELPRDPMLALAALAGGAAVPDGHGVISSFDEDRCRAPVPRPSKIFAAAHNYRSHVDEEQSSVPDEPQVFGRFSNALNGPRDDILLPGFGDIDWEAEVVAVIGRRGRGIRAADAWRHVFGLAAGQDLTDRLAQDRGLKQYTLAKSYDSFAPVGPWVLTTDELPDPDDLAIRCWLNGELVQEGRTGQLVFGVPALIEWISRSCTLEVGDLIFTGTPGGVGASRIPPRFLKAGDILETEVDLLGKLVNSCVAWPDLQDQAVEGG